MRSPGGTPLVCPPFSVHDVNMGLMYCAIAGELKYIRSVGDFFTILRMTKIGRGVIHKLIGGLETFGVAPAGTQKTADALAVAADSLVAGAKDNLFTPMYMMIARKPLNA